MLKIKTSFNISIWILLLVISSYGCHSIFFKHQLDLGKAQSEEFFETIPYDSPLGLVIIPVQIKGNTYHFLFDTGAPNAISEEIQMLFNFPIIRKKNITDSQHIKTKVEWVELDSLFIGNAAFIGTTAFVSNLKLNPIIACLEIDGIIGSNLMRYCLWQIDPENETVSLTNKNIETLKDETFTQVHFYTNHQHTPKLDLKSGNTTINNITLDYGYSGSLSLPHQSFNTLVDAIDSDQILSKIGSKQSGLFGEITPDTSKIALIKEAMLDSLQINNIKMESSNSKLLGMEVLKRFVISLDWQNNTMWMKSIEPDEQKHLLSYGLNYGLNDEGKVYAQAVVADGPAYIAGIRPGNILEAYDEIIFDEPKDFCIFIDLKRRDRDSAVIQFLDYSNTAKTVTLRKQNLFVDH